MSGRVLLIEDSDDIVRLISNVLEDVDYSLVVATNGEAGLAVARAETPDVILLDMSLPKLSGWDLVPQLRAEGITIPVIALTAHAMRQDRERALALGCSEYITKPFEIDELLDTIDRYMPNGH